MSELLQIFLRSSDKHYLIASYDEMLQSNLEERAIKSKFFSLTSAVKFLRYCEYFDGKQPSMDILEGYLWLYPKRKNSLIEFTNFLRTQCSYDLSIEKIQTPKLSRPKRSHQILKNKLIKIMRNPQNKFLKEEYFFKVAIGYLHWVAVPKNVHIGVEDISKNKNGDHYLQLCAHSFFIPSEIVVFITDFKKDNSH